MEDKGLKNHKRVTDSKDILTLEIQQWLTSLFLKELKIEPNDMRSDKEFQDYGVDSILLSQILTSVNALIGSELDPTILYEYSTIESFSLFSLNSTILSQIKLDISKDLNKSSFILQKNKFMKSFLIFKKEELIGRFQK